VDAETGAMIAAVASAIAVVITALRQRKDSDIADMQKKIADQGIAMEMFEEELVELRAQLLACEKKSFALQMVLASNGIAIPSEEIA
jgi:hypothetical protein